MKNGSTRNKNGNDISASLMLYFAYLKFIMLFGWCEKVKYFFVDTKTQLSLVIRKFETEMIIFLLLIYVMKNKLFSPFFYWWKKKAYLKYISLSLRWYFSLGRNHIL